MHDVYLSASTHSDNDRVKNYLYNNSVYEYNIVSI
jgi:hypothetical protein